MITVLNSTKHKYMYLIPLYYISKKLEYISYQYKDHIAMHTILFHF